MDGASVVDLCKDSSCFFTSTREGKQPIVPELDNFRESHDETV